MSINQIQTPPVLTPSAANAAGADYAGIPLQDSQVFPEPLLSNIPQQSARWFGYPLQCQVMWLTERSANVIAAAGQVTLDTGAATVETAAVQADSLIFVSCSGSSHHSVSSDNIVAGVSFDIVGTGTDVVNWFIVNPS